MKPTERVQVKRLAALRSYYARQLAEWWNPAQRRLLRRERAARDRARGRAA